jgi:hypothetical protein
MLWVDKQHSMKQLHLDIFRHFRPVLGLWIDWTDPQSKKKDDPKCSKMADLIDFPYRVSEDK